MTSPWRRPEESQARLTRRVGSEGRHRFTNSCSNLLGRVTMPEEVSLFRLYLMRALYLLNFVLLGMDVWPGLIHHGKPWDPMHGIAVSFWAALSTLSALGIRYPLRMLPLMLMQLFTSRYGCWRLASRCVLPARWTRWPQSSSGFVLSGLLWILLSFPGRMFCHIT
jgi:hypothetical protein